MNWCGVDSGGEGRGDRPCRADRDGL